MRRSNYQTGISAGRGDLRRDGRRTLINLNDWIRFTQFGSNHPFVHPTAVIDQKISRFSWKLCHSQRPMGLRRFSTRQRGCRPAPRLVATIKVEQSSSHSNTFDHFSERPHRGFSWLFQGNEQSPKGPQGPPERQPQTGLAAPLAVALTFRISDTRA